MVNYCPVCEIKAGTEADQTKDIRYFIGNPARPNWNITYKILKGIATFDPWPLTDPVMIDNI